MNLELKHLSAYLPYGVECYLMGHTDENENPISERILGSYDNDIVYVTLNCDDYDEYNNADVLLILRPLSDLVNEIEQNGERFVPLLKIFDSLNLFDCGDRISFTKWNVDDESVSIIDEDKFDREHVFTIYNNNQVVAYSIDNENVIINTYSIIQMLLSWHFDIFGLIDAGLAIDINKLKGGSE